MLRTRNPIRTWPCVLGLLVGCTSGSAGDANDGNSTAEPEAGADSPDAAADAVENARQGDALVNEPSRPRDDAAAPRPEAGTPPPADDPLPDAGPAPGPDDAEAGQTTSPECDDDGACSGDAPVCADGRCVACNGSADCADGLTCDAAHTCVAQALIPAWELDCEHLPSDATCQGGPHEVLLAIQETGRISMFAAADGTFLGYLKHDTPTASHYAVYSDATQGPDMCIWTTLTDGVGGVGGGVQRWHPDGRFVDTLIPQGKHFVTDANGDDQDVIDDPLSVAFSADAVYVASTAGSPDPRVTRFGLDGSFQEVVLDDGSQVRSLLVLQDGRLVLADAATYQVAILDLETGERTPLWTDVSPGQLSYAGAGRVLATSPTTHEPVTLIDLATGERSSVKLASVSYPAYGAGILGDGRWLITTGEAQTGVGILDPTAVPAGQVLSFPDDRAILLQYPHQRIGRACVSEAVLEAARPRVPGGPCPTPPEGSEAYAARFETVDSLDGVEDPSGRASLQPVDGSGTLRVHGGEIRGGETSLPMGDLRPHYVHLRSRVTDTETASGYMALRDAAGHDFETLYFSHGLLRSFNSRVQPAASDETWYEIELVNIDWDRGVYDLCVDGELVLPDVTWNRSRDDTGVARLSLYNESEDVDLWIDDVVVK